MALPDNSFNASSYFLTVFGRPESASACECERTTEASLAQSENVRAALAFVARGEARLGIVYATDARAEPKVEVAGVFPDDSHPPIVYPAAVISSSQNPDSQVFVTYLSSPKAKEIFTAQGFTILK